MVVDFLIFRLNRDQPVVSDGETEVPGENHQFNHWQLSHMPLSGVVVVVVLEVVVSSCNSN